MVQGISTVVATGFFNLQEIEDAFKVAVQLALQGNAILSQIDTDIVLDVSALSDSLATLPPIEPTQPAPIQTPVASPGVPAAPIDVVPSPTIQITFAPVPDLLPTRPISQATSPPTVAVGSAPVAAPLSIAPVPVAASPQSPQSTTDSPVATIEVLPVEPDVPRDDNSSNGGLEWWGWLCISIGGGIFVLCCLGMARRSGSANSPSCLPSTSGKSHDRNEKDDDDDRLNRTDPDPEDHTYEPPSSINEAFIPSSLGAFTVAPNEDSEKPTQEPGQSLFGNHPPPAPATAAASSAALEDDDDEVEEMEESFTEEDEEVEEEYDEDEEDEDEDEDAEEENENGEAFEEEEESYFEEEELFENDSHPSQNWGNPPQGYDSRF